MVIQIIRASTFERDRFFIFIEAFWANTFMFSVILFFVAYQLKFKNTIKLVLLIVSFIILFNLILHFYPNFLQYR